MPIDPTNPSDIQLIDLIVRRTIEAMRGEGAGVAYMPRLTVEQFACAVELSAEVVRRKIRTREIPAALVFGECPKRLSPKALDLFGVTPHEARARLAAHSLLPDLQRSAA